MNGANGVSTQKRTSTVQLVALREIKERTRSKVFIGSTVIPILVVIAGIVVPKLTEGNERTYRVGLVQPLSAPVVQAIRSVGASVGAKVATQPEASIDAASTDLKRGGIDLAVTQDKVLVKKGLTPGDVTKKARLAAAISSAVGVQLGLERAGVAPATAQRALASPALPIDGLTPPTPSRSGQRVAATYGSIMLYSFLGLYGYWILNGVVEEKTSRVVEVLLATMRPGELLAGKVVGIGIVALGQATLILATALGTAALVGSTFLKGATASTLLFTFLWFLLGYAFFSTVYAAAGSLVSRQEEAQNAAFPILLPLVVAFFTSFGPLSTNTGNGFLTFLSFFPASAPISMPVRVAIGDAAPIEIVISIAIELAAIVVMGRLAAKVYAGAILRVGKKLRARDVLKARAAEA